MILSAIVPDTLSIDRLSHDGRGIARRDGKVCFVAGALPGETVQARCLKDSARFSEFEVISIDARADGRVDTPCRHIGACGGCDLMHLAAPLQLEHKTRSLVELLERQAHIGPAAIDPPLTSTPFGYRRRARLAVDATLEGGPVVGYRGAGTRDVAAIDACMALAGPLAALPGQLTTVLRTLAVPRAVGHLEVAVSETSAGADEPVVGVRQTGVPHPGDAQRWLDWARLNGVSLAHELDGAEAMLVYAPHGEAPGYGLPDFGLRLEFLPGDFLQANAPVNRALVNLVVEWCDAGTGSRVLDAFSGLGNFSLPLARRGAEVLGIEISLAMVRRATRNAVANSVHGVKFAARDLQAATPVVGGERFDVVVLDPPRAGAAPLVRSIAASRIPRVVYVSCAPGTFIRDAQVLAAAGYVLDRLAAVDMFPQTSHSESIALFTLRGKARRPRNAA